MTDVLVFTTAAASFCTLGLLLGAGATLGVLLYQRSAVVHARPADHCGGSGETDVRAPVRLPGPPIATARFTPPAVSPAAAGPTLVPAGHTPGTVVGPYRLHSLLGQGGMGEVWHAFDTRRDRHVALKLLPTRDVPADAHRRMRREARLAGRLSSAHVIPIHDFGSIDGAAFLDMRLVPGGDLATLLHTAHPHGLGPHRVGRIVAQIADALDAAHAAGLVHCDVKPSNVLLDTTTAGDFCYLADFGVALAALATHTGRSPAPTGENLIFGTPTYMAPELFTGTGGPSVASDVYALAVLCHELLTGHPPFTDADLRALRDPHTHQPPPNPALDPTLAALDPILTQALAANPEQRHPSAGAFAAAFTAAVITALTAPPANVAAAPSNAASSNAASSNAAPSNAAPSNAPGNVVVGLAPAEPARCAPTAPDDSLEAVFRPSAPPPAAARPHPVPAAAAGLRSSAA